MLILQIPADELIAMIRDNYENDTIDTLLSDLIKMRDDANDAWQRQTTAIADEQDRQRRPRFRSRSDVQQWLVSKLSERQRFVYLRLLELGWKTDDALQAAKTFNRDGDNPTLERIVYSLEAAMRHKLEDGNANPAASGE